MLALLGSDQGGTSHVVAQTRGLEVVGQIGAGRELRVAHPSSRVLPMKGPTAPPFHSAWKGPTTGTALKLTA
ncbi:MAG: hypothetical protein ACE5FD_19640, partial [Anaerolineae bacterium]